MKYLCRPNLCTYNCEYATFVRFQADPDPAWTFYDDVHPDPDLVELAEIIMDFNFKFLKDCLKIFRLVLIFVIK